MKRGQTCGKLPLYDECGRYSQRVKLFKISCLQDCKRTEQGTCRTWVYYNGRHFGHPKAFALSENGFEWLGDYEITADEVLGGIAPKANKMEQAKRLIQKLAEINNAMQGNEIFSLADEQGISKWTLENVKKELGIRAKRINNTWYWELDKIKQ